MAVYVQCGSQLAVTVALTSHSILSLHHSNNTDTLHVSLSTDADVDSRT